MTDLQIYLVKKSFEKVAPISEQAAALFYAKLFDLDASVITLFKGDMREQGKKLMQVIAYAVEHLDQIDKLIPKVRELGLRHGTYGVRDEHYEMVGEALLWTLEKALSLDFTPETKEAWAQTYGFLAETMKAACHQQKDQAAKF